MLPRNLMLVESCKSNDMPFCKEKNDSLFAAAKNKKRKTAFEDDLQSKNKFWRYLQQSRIRQHVQHYAVIVNNKIRQNRKVKKRFRDNRREVIFFLSFQTNITNNIHNLFDKNRQYPIIFWMSKMCCQFGG